MGGISEIVARKPQFWSRADLNSRASSGTWILSEFEEIIDRPSYSPPRPEDWEETIKLLLARQTVESGYVILRGSTQIYKLAFNDAT